MFDERNVYTLTLLDIQGRKVCLDTYKNKILIIVNLESLDGFANQSLLALKHFKEEDFSNIYEILIFPITDYLRPDQCKREFLKEFFIPYKNELKLFDFISINNKHTLFEYLFSIYTEWRGNALRSNFSKFVVYDGKIVHLYNSNESPMHSDDVLRRFKKKREYVFGEKKNENESNNFY
ncbi:putative phospholipid hydroperoxide glutathion [Tubulinosema ratisbonensis]|uniref:Putative phospholipid hydroperoxide glutathion n=1 Tax=Tubulinosema ratisbonensis TaxID=291195 RepID=A0A437APW3_9MICR|nr:putative phospholipid hydroperoxide glutathion [Tubulinosema ratisbonensis]